MVFYPNIVDTKNVSAANMSRSLPTSFKQDAKENNIKIDTLVSKQ